MAAERLEGRLCLSGLGAAAPATLTAGGEGEPLLAPMLLEINPNSSSLPSHFTGVGSDVFFSAVFFSAVFFSADDGATGLELWKTDGTPGGTVLVKDINPDNNYQSGSLPRDLVAVGNTLFFSAGDEGELLLAIDALLAIDGAARASSPTRALEPSPEAVVAVCPASSSDAAFPREAHGRDAAIERPSDARWNANSHPRLEIPLLDDGEVAPTEPWSETAPFGDGGAHANR